MNFDSYTICKIKTTLSFPIECYSCYRNNIGMIKGQKTKRFKKAFTLAETLITLTIIGIIAVLTIPTLMSKYQKHIYLTGIKKAYSNLQSAYKMIPLSAGCPAGDYVCAGLKGTGFNDYFNPDDLKIISKQFKIQKYFETQEELKKFYENSGYKAPYTGYTGLGSQGFLTDDGTIYFDSSISSGIVVDTNGVKGPNEACKDIVKFHVVPVDYTSDYYAGNTDIIKAGTIIPDPYCEQEMLFGTRL